MAEWKWPEYTLPAYVRSHVNWRDLDQANNDYILVREEGSGLRFLPFEVREKTLNEWQ